jgi:hypothetical protein
MKPNLSAGGGVEAAVFVFALAMAAEVLLRVIPGLDSYAVDTVAAIRLSMFALACFGLGYWVRHRYRLDVRLAAVSFAIGVIAAFVIRAIREGADGPLRSEDLGFSLGLAFANWIVLLLGALVAMRRAQ